MKKSIQIREEEHFEQMLQYAASAGFHEVAISFGSCDLLSDDALDRDVVRIQALLEQYRLRCTQTHLPCYHLLVSAEETDAAVERAIGQYLRASAALGASWCAFHPRSAVNDGFDRQKSFEANKNTLSIYLEYAELYGTGIAVENMPLYPSSNPQWRFFGGGYEELCELCDTLHSDRIGICWDFGHAHTAALDQYSALKAIGSRLKITHVHDNYRNGDHHQLPLLGTDPGWHPIDWKRAMEAAAAIGYDGPLTLELLYPPLPMLENFIRCCYDCLGCLTEMADTAASSEKRNPSDR